MNFYAFFLVAYISGIVAIAVSTLLSVLNFRAYKQAKDESENDKKYTYKWQFVIYLVESLICFAIIQVLSYVILQDKQFIIRDLFAYLNIFLISLLLPLTDKLKTRLASLKTVIVSHIFPGLEYAGGLLAVMYLIGYI